AAGRLIQIVCDPSSHACRGYARAGEEWIALGGGFEIPARATRVELKAEGWNDSGDDATVWFDDCRLYPSPGTHYVSVRLVRRDARATGLGAGDRWPLVAFDAEGGELRDGDVSVALYTRDGATKVDEAAVTLADGFAMLRLDT